MAREPLATLTLGGDWYADVEARYLVTGLMPACDNPHCLREAALLDVDQQRALCFQCGEDLVERLEAIGLYPGLAETLPPLTER